VWGDRAGEGGRASTSAALREEFISIVRRGKARDAPHTEKRRYTWIVCKGVAARTPLGRSDAVITFELRVTKIGLGKIEGSGSSTSLRTAGK